MIPRAALAVLAAALMAGCATAPAETPAPAPKLSYEQQLEQGRQAQKAGNNAQAYDSWRAAARTDPAAKEPWLRIAQTAFDAGEYGTAITAAQEAMQRDGNDAAANGLLAVSGLRVSSAALGRMRSDNLDGSARNEAESLARMLRALLGAPVLVPQAPVANAKEAPKTAVKPKPKAPGAQPAGIGAAAPAAASGTAPKPADGARDPLGQLTR